MAKRPPEYFSCARCGYRGISKPEDHECDPARLVAAEPIRQGNMPVIDPSARMTAFHAAAGSDPVIRGAIADQVARVKRAEDSFGVPQALRLADDLKGFLGRAVNITIESQGYRVHQRCEACRVTFAKAAVPSDDYLTTLTAVGLRARTDYLLHKCEPVERSLHAIPTDDLRELYEQLERDSQRLMERAIEVQRVLDKRLAEEQAAKESG